MPVEKKTFIIAIILSAFLLSPIAGTELVKKVEAWPPYEPSAESLITISVSSPEANKLYNTKPVKLDFDVTVGETTDHSLISNICYETDWQKENKTIFSFDGYFLRDPWGQLSGPRTFIDPISTSFQSLELTDVPEGNHSIKIYATVWHYSSIEKLKSAFEYYLQYRDLTMASRSATVSFVVDTVSPKIVFSSPKNLTYDSSDVSVNFTVNELFSKCFYSLDGQDNVTIAGNMTLADLLYGEHSLKLFAIDAAGNMGVSETIKFTVALVIHVLSPERRTYDTSSIPLNFTVNSASAQITYCLNGEKNSTIPGNTTLNGLANGDYALTVYAKDEAGNVGTSETILFTVDVPFPTLIVVSVITVAVVSIGLLVYFKKRTKP
jgi:hypothetical protein